MTDEKETIFQVVEADLDFAATYEVEIDGQKNQVYIAKTDPMWGNQLDDSFVSMSFAQARPFQQQWIIVSASWFKANAKAIKINPNINPWRVPAFEAGIFGNIQNVIRVN